MACGLVVLGTLLLPICASINYFFLFFVLLFGGLVFPLTRLKNLSVVHENGCYGLS